MKNEDQTINVGIADDHTLFAFGLAKLLNSVSNIKTSIIANSGMEFLRKIDSNGLPDVILLDIETPEMDGFMTTKELKKRFPEVKIIVLSMHQEFNYICRMIEYGASGYILKNSTPDEVVDAILRVHKGETVYNQQVQAMMRKYIECAANHTISGYMLSEKEIRIIKMVKNENTNKEIAQKLCVSLSTIEACKREIIKKMGVKTSVGMVAFAIQNRLI